MTQHQIILKICKKKWISPAEAFMQGAGMKLSTRIGELKRSGHVFDSKWSEGKKFKLYRLVKNVK